MARAIREKLTSAGSRDGVITLLRGTGKLMLRGYLVIIPGRAYDLRNWAS